MLAKPQTVFTYIKVQSLIIDELINYIQLKQNDMKQIILNDFDVTLKYLAFEC